jgi:uncharacterized coiled-coil DUF342 family protein
MTNTPETQCAPHYYGCACHEKEWQNKWQCAVEMAAQAEAKLDALVEHHTRMIIAHAKEVDALMWAREIHSCHNACAKPICTLRRERDEARKDVRDLMEQYQDHLQYGDEFEDSALIQGICDRLSEWETEQAKPWAADQ